MWDRLKAQSDAFLAAQVPEPIQVTLPDGKIVEAQSWRTTPYEVACGISKGLADNSVISKVDGEVWDLDRPLEKSCALQLLKFDDEDAQVRFSAKQKFSYSNSLFLVSSYNTLDSVFSVVQKKTEILNPQFVNYCQINLCLLSRCKKKQYCRVSVQELETSLLI